MLKERDSRLFRLFDENEKEIGHGICYFENNSAEVVFDGLTRGYDDLAEVLRLEGVKSFMWCCPESKWWVS